MKKYNVFLLILFISIAVFSNFIPKIGYEYPLHVDEWVHFQYSSNISDGTNTYFGEESNTLEKGFHLILGILNLFGIEYLIMFKFLPSLLTILICLGIFISTRKVFNESAGVYSVLFFALIKSSVSILGPVFLVPMSIGLFFIAMCLFLIWKGSGAWVLLFAGILSIHPPTAVAIFLLINIEFFCFLVSKEIKSYLKNILLQGVSFFMALPFYIPFFIEKGKVSGEYLVFTVISEPIFIPRFIGYLMTAIILVGIYFYAERKEYKILVHIAALLSIIGLFYYFDLELFVPYRRSLMYLFILFSMFFGYGLYKIVDMPKKRKDKLILFVILVIVILIVQLPSKISQKDKMYKVINDSDYEAFIWIKENVQNNPGELAVLDPWKANAFTPIAGKMVYSRIVQGPNLVYEERNEEIKTFFENGCNDINFLIENDISIVYGECRNPKLEEVYPNVYIYN